MKHRLRIDAEFHYNDKHTQRVTRAQWRDALLSNQDRIIIRGYVRTLQAFDIGCGVMELRLKSIDGLEMRVQDWEKGKFQTAPTEVSKLESDPL